MDFGFFTVKTIENIIVAFYQSIRQNGIVYIYLLYILFLSKIDKIQIFVLLNYLTSLLIFSLLVFGLVELRWLGGIFIAAGVMHLNSEQKIHESFRLDNLQKLIVLFFSLGGILRFLH